MERLWPLPQGLCMQRVLHKDDSDLPILYALLHPLSEPTPISMLKNEGDEPKFIMDEKYTVVFSSYKIPYFVVYDELENHHEVWLIRRGKASQDKTYDIAKVTGEKLKKCMVFLLY